MSLQDKGDKIYIVFNFRLNVLTRDLDSGIYRIDWRLISNNSDVVFRSGQISGNRSKVCTFRELYTKHNSKYINLLL